LLTNPPILPASEADIRRYNSLWVPASYGQILTWVLDVETPYTAKPSLTSRFGQKEGWMQVVESVMGQIRREDRARVGELILVWRCNVLEDDKSVALTHMKVCRWYCNVELD
jgi:hypothetical protein